MSRPPSRLRWRAGVTAFAVASLLVSSGCVPLLFMAPADAEDDSTANPQLRITNRAPIADAGGDQIVRSGEAVVLNATGSRDDDHDRLTFAWQQVSGSPNVTLTGAFSSIARFDATDVTQPTTLVFSLTVVDGYAAARDEVAVTIAP